MKAELLPLEGKYYGTKVKITGDAGDAHIINLWNSGSWVPSCRELNGQMTEAQWIANEIIHGHPAKDIVDIGDGHFESRETFATAQAIVRSINATSGRETADSGQSVKGKK